MRRFISLLAFGLSLDLIASAMTVEEAYRAIPHRYTPFDTKTVRSGFPLSASFYRAKFNQTSHFGFGLLNRSRSTAFRSPNAFSPLPTKLEPCIVARVRGFRAARLSRMLSVSGV
jgi:hypothetical protein